MACRCRMQVAIKKVLQDKRFKASRRGPAGGTGVGPHVGRKFSIRGSACWTEGVDTAEPAAGPCLRRHELCSLGACATSRAAAGRHPAARPPPPRLRRTVSCRSSA